MKSRNLILSTFALAALLLLSPAAAQADPVNLTLTPASALPPGTPITAYRGSVITFLGTFANVSQTAQAVNSGLVFTPSPTQINIAGAPGLTFPIALTPGQVRTLPLLSVTISQTAAFGLYTGGISIFSGPVGSGFLDTASFAIQVQPVPEPATMILLGTGLASVVGAARRRRK